MIVAIVITAAAMYALTIAILTSIILQAHAIGDRGGIKGLKGLSGEGLFHTGNNPFKQCAKHSGLPHCSSDP